MTRQNDGVDMIAKAGFVLSFFGALLIFFFGGRGEAPSILFVMCLLFLGAAALSK